MAAIRDYAVSIEAAAVATMICEMPEHVTGDLLVLFFNKDTATGGPSTPSGWTLIDSQGSAGAFGCIFAKRATSSSEAVTLTYTSETSVAVIVSIKNCFGSTVADALTNNYKTVVDDSTLPYDGGVFTPSYNNSLILGALSTDTGLGPSALPGWVNIFAGDAGANSLCVSYTYQKIAAEITHPGYWAATQDDTRAFLIAIRDDGNETEVSPYVDRGTVPCVLVTPHIGATGTAALQAAQRGIWVTVAPLDIADIGGKTLTLGAVTAVADSGYNPFRGSSRHASTSSKTVLYGCECRLITPEDMTIYSGILFGTWQFSLPRDYLDCGKVATGGVLFGIADAENDYRFWTLGAQFAETTTPAGDRKNYAIEVNTIDTAYASIGTLALDAINDLYIAGAGYYGACLYIWSDLYILNETVLAGGTPVNPLNFLDVVYAVNQGSGNIPLMLRVGSAATAWTRLRFGGGDPLHLLVNLRTFQFPKKSDGIDYLDFHVSNNKIGVEFYGLSGDTLKFTNSVFTSDSPYYWRFNASHNAGCTLDFSGTSVVNATVTLRSAVSLNGTTFIDCSTFTQNNAALNSCNFDNTKISSDNPEDISNCSFISGGTGHAIEILDTYTGTYDFVGNTFSGYGANETTDAAVYNNSGGAVTLNITNGGTTPTVRNGSGASTTINNSVNLTITVKDEQNNNVENARVAIYKTADMTQLMNELTNASGVAQESFNYVGDTPVIIRVRKSSSTPKFIPVNTTGTIGSAGLNTTVTFVQDLIAS